MCSGRWRPAVSSIGLWVLFCAFLTAVGIAFWTNQIYKGLGVTGYGQPTMWAVYITNFVFWVGIAHSGTLISAILFLFRVRWRTAVYRCAETMTVFAVLTAGLFPLIHLGRVWFFYWLRTLSERALPAAGLPLAPGVGLLRDQHLPDDQHAVPVYGADSRPRQRTRGGERMA